MRKIQQGFTLIELMIVVAIIGILAAIAIPQYTKYVARSESNTGLQAIAALKTAAEDYYAQGAPAAITLATLGTIDKASPLGTIATDLDNSTGTGTITFTFDGSASPAVKGKKHTLTRAGTGAWTCTSDVPVDYMPKGCS